MPTLDQQFIGHTVNQNPGNLEYLPKSVIIDRWVRDGLYVMQRDLQHQPIGFLLHGTVNDDRSLYIHHSRLNLDPKNQLSARRAVTQLVKRACTADAETILLRCASTLETIQFWHSLAFIPVAISEAGARNPMTIVQYECTLGPRPRLPASGVRPEPLQPAA